MKIGVFDPVFGDLELEPMLDRIVQAGLEAVEIGTGNYPGHRHCIEHQDGLATVDEGLANAIATLRECVLTEAPSAMWWA